MTQLQSDVTAIKTETDTISSQVLPAITNVGTKVDNVQSYLSDPNAGLPKILSNQTTEQNQMKALRRGGILNRDMQLDVNQTATIQYRSEGGVPSLNMYNGAGAVVGGIPPLSLNPATGLYESTFSLAATGEYRAVVNEAASANSAGTVDGITLSVKSSTVQDLSGITTTLAALGSQINTIDANVNNLATMTAVIQADTGIIKTQANTIFTDTQALRAKWGTMDAQTLSTQLNALSTQMGTPAQAASVQTVLTQLASLQTNLSSLSTQMGTPAQAGSLQAVADQVTQVQAAIAAIPGALDYSGRFDKVDICLATLQTAVNSISGGGGSGGGGGDLTTIQTTLSTLSQSVTALQSQVGDPAQRTTLDGAIVTLTNIQASMAKEATVQSALGALATLQTDVTTLSTQVGTPAQAAALQVVANQVTALQAAIAALPGATDYTPQLTALQNSLTALNGAVGTLGALP